MNFTEAKQALDSGHKVKLPEWTGYWFKEDSKIKVFTGSGEVIDNPYLEDYTNRQDWEFTDGTRNFGGALVALKAGRLVARAGWNGKGMFLYLVKGTQFKVDRQPLLSAFAEGTVVDYCPHIDMKTADNKCVPWLASQTDILAEDWMIIE